MLDYDLLHDLYDLVEAAQSTNEENMTGLELAQLLGVPFGTDNKPDSIDFLNACIHVQDNEEVKKLPHDQKIRAIRTAIAVLDHMRG